MISQVECLSKNVLVPFSRLLPDSQLFFSFLLKCLDCRTILILGFVFLGGNIFAQYDTIKFTNGSKQAAKIIEISDKYVKYKNPLDTLGPTFSVKRRDVSGFVLKSGCIDMEQQGYVDCVKDPTFELIKEKEFTRRIISIDASQFFVKHFQMNAEYIFKNKSKSVNVFFNFGFPDEDDKETYEGLEIKTFSSGYYKNIYLGFDVKFFPGAHKKFTYFYALGFDYGTAYKMVVEPYYTAGFYSYLAFKTSFPEARYFGYRFNNGVVCRFYKNFLGQAVVTLGVNQFTNENIEKKKREHSFAPKVVGSILLGYAF